MSDDKDLEIARLQGRIDGMAAAKGVGAGMGTLKVLGVLALVAVGVFGCMAVIGSMLPPEPTLAERQAECERIHGEAASKAGNDCMMGNLAREIERQRR